MSNPYAAPAAALDEASIAAGETYQPKIFALDGRLGRLRYWAYGVLVAVLSGILVYGVMWVATGGAHKSMLTDLIATIPLLYLVRRRLHDLDRNGWLSVLILIPLLNVFFSLYLVFARGTDGPNEYGPPPAPNSRGLVITTWVLVGLFVVAIGAAIAFGAYQGYQQAAKSHASQGL
ncbi:MAG: DUF805 domain-containing protein [Telluria sp.]